MYIGEKMSIAIEILSMKFSKGMFNKKEYERILKYRELVYKGDQFAIEEVVEVLGKELRKDMKKNG